MWLVSEYTLDTLMHTSWWYEWAVIIIQKITCLGNPCILRAHDSKYDQAIAYEGYMVVIMEQQDDLYVSI